MRYLRQRFPSITISVEIEKAGREGLQDLATEANIVFYSKSWAKVSIADLPSQELLYVNPSRDLGQRI